MRNLYIVFRNVLVFCFVIVVFGASNILKDNSVASILGVGIVFGVSMMLVPNILKFFKLPVNNGSHFLMSIIISFLFFFIGLYIFNFLKIPSGGSIDFGISFIPPLKLQDRTVALVILSLFTTITSSLLDYLGRQK